MGTNLCQICSGMNHCDEVVYVEHAFRENGISVKVSF